MDRLGVALLAVSLASFANAVVKVLDLDVPESVEIGSTDEIVMVCNFVASKDEAAEMKWFYNGNIEQIYQWIPDSDKPPGAIGRFKERLDVEHSSPDPRAKYNTLKIKDVSYDLSGNYTCKISGIKSEDSQTKQLVVYFHLERPSWMKLQNHQPILYL
ncbi:unnamed protein product [Acanthoscelides obtectus]|uniref:Ig-like domain-containing protein n=1 Tax=Acanthoscelides obtectus TaxID=200917 RepID=A0A9P0PCN6_ACAOB|nr:unnamed protein product [Acanthoscelides obtectus]CAK1675851.1 hypothetical protein AOBTE_LOCUS30444 [Acanthoscelides obtectus]